MGDFFLEGVVVLSLVAHCSVMLAYSDGFVWGVKGCRMFCVRAGRTVGVCSVVL